MEFNFVDQGSGFYPIHSVNGRQDLCLNISTAASSPGDGMKFGGPGNLIQWSCSGSTLFDNELFKLVDLGGGRQQIRVRNSGLCLEDRGVEAPSARTFDNVSGTSEVPRRHATFDFILIFLNFAEFISRERGCKASVMHLKIFGPASRAMATATVYRYFI
jgi:hypothetical protein